MKRKHLLLTMLVAICVLGSCDKPDTSSSSSTPSSEPSSNETSSDSSVGENSSEEVVEVESIRFTNKISKIRTNATYQVEYEILPSNATDSNAILTSSNEDAVSIINDEMLLAKNLGTSTITVSTLNGKSDSFELEVIGPEVFVLNLSAPKEVISVGETMLLEAIPSPEDAVFSEILFESSNESVASVDSDGLVTGLSVGKVTITAKIEKDDGTFVSANVDIEVKNIAVDSIMITNNETELLVGNSLAIQYEILPNNAFNKKVSFSSDNESVASVNDEGIVSAHKVGDVTIIVTTEDGAHSDSLELNVVSSYDRLYDQAIAKIAASEELEKVLGLNATFTSHKVTTNNTTDIEESISFYTEDSHVFSNVSTMQKTSNDTTTNSKTYHGFDSNKNKYYTFKYDVDKDSLSNNYVYDANQASSQELYKKQSQLVYNDNWGTYGLFAYANKMITSGSTLGASALSNDAKVIVLTDDSVTISVQYEPSVSSINQSTILFYDITFTVNFNEDGGITSTNYVSKKYNQDGYSYETHEIIAEATPYEFDVQTYTLNYGARSKDTSDFKPNKILYFVSYEMGLYASYSDSEEIANVEVGKTFYIKVKSSTPSTASMKMDKVEIKEVTVLSGNVNLTKNSFTYSSSSEYYYAKATASGRVKVTFISTENKVESSLEFDIVPPQATGIDPYYNGKYLSGTTTAIPSLEIGKTATLSAKIYPTDAEQNYSITASNNNVSLTKQDDGSYIMQALSRDEDEGTVLITWSTSNGKTTQRTIKIVEPVSIEALTLDKLKELFANGTYQGKVSNITHILTFNADGTGKAEFEKTYGYMEFTYVIEESDEQFTIKFVVTDVSNEKYYEGTRIMRSITIAKDSAGDSFSLYIDGSYSSNATYTYVAN